MNGRRKSSWYFSTLKYFWKVQVWADAKLSFVNKLSVITEAQETFSSKCQRIWPNIYLCPRFIFKEQKKLLKIYLCQNNCRLQFKNHLRNKIFTCKNRVKIPAPHSVMTIQCRAQLGGGHTNWQKIKASENATISLFLKHPYPRN